MPPPAHLSSITKGFEWGLRALIPAAKGLLIARRRARAGRLGLRAMLSVEPCAVADCAFVLRLVLNCEHGTSDWTELTVRR